MIDQKNGGDERYTTKVRKAEGMVITKVNYSRWVHFLMILNRGGSLLGIFSFVFYIS